LANFFGSDAQNWMKLQAGYDIETAQLASAERIKRYVTPRKVAA